jgi:hypothetical protein
MPTDEERFSILLEEAVRSFEAESRALVGCYVGSGGKLEPLTRILATLPLNRREECGAQLNALYQRIRRLTEKQALL